MIGELSRKKSDDEIFVPTPVPWRGREKLAPFIDHGSSVDLVRTPFPKVVGWRFTSDRGMALTAVSVADGRREISFPNTTGTWEDGVSGDQFTAQDNTLTVPIPAHSVRLLHAGAGENPRQNSHRR